jgi:hypothetical protein
VLPLICAGFGVLAVSRTGEGETLSVVVAVRDTVEEAHSEVVVSIAADNSRSWGEEVELSGGLVDCSGLT